MTARTYPRDAWVLTPSMKPKKVRIIKPYRSFGQDYGDVADTGTPYMTHQMHETCEAALDWALKDLARQQEKINKMQAMLDKRRETIRNELKKVIT